MKNLRIILWLALLLPAAGMAQEQGIAITETFEGSTQLEWPEYAEKGSSALLQDGCFKLTKSSKKGKIPSVAVELPIQLDRDFTIDCKVLAARLSAAEPFVFGVGTNSFSIFEGKLIRLGTQRFTKIKLKGGKDVTVALRFEYLNGKSSLYINNMKVEEFDHPIDLPACAFSTLSELSIQEFSVIQE